jgi:hypothetical protein
MSYNCHTNAGHVQSMIWATDSVGLDVILTPDGIGECFATMPAAQNGEIRTTQLLRENGYDVDVFLSVYHSKDRETKQRLLTDPGAGSKETDAEAKQEDTEAKEAASDADGATDIKEEDPAAAEKREIEMSSPGANSASLSVPGDFWKSCTDEDWLGPGSYFGTFVHPYENLFMKSHRHIEDTVLDRLTEWHDGWGYSSYDVCF